MPKPKMAIGRGVHQQRGQHRRGRMFGESAVRSTPTVYGWRPISTTYQPASRDETSRAPASASRRAAISIRTALALPRPQRGEREREHQHAEPDHHPERVEHRLHRRAFAARHRGQRLDLPVQRMGEDQAAELPGSRFRNRCVRRARPAPRTPPAARPAGRVARQWASIAASFTGWYSRTSSRAGRRRTPAPAPRSRRTPSRARASACRPRRAPRGAGTTR